IFQEHEVTKSIKCYACNKIFYSKSDFKKHARNRHERKYSYGCHICGLRFDSLKHKWDHLWNEHKERAINNDCPLCTKAYRRYTDLKKHVQQEHANTLTDNGASVLRKIKEFREQSLKQKKNYTY
ncbi:unnamed protein product, partial [Leptidea sinapis]